MTPDEVRAWRESKGWSTYRAVKVLGIEWITWRRWEKGESKPSRMAINYLRLYDENQDLKERLNGKKLPTKKPTKKKGASENKKL